MISHTDALTMNELDVVREAVRRDLAEAFPDDPGLGFGIFGAVDEDEFLVRQSYTPKLTVDSPHLELER